MKVVVGVPEYWMLDARWQNPIIAWISDSPGIEVEYCPVPSANHTVNLSRVLEIARKTEQLRWLILLETDILPQITLNATCDRLLWNKAADRDVIASGIRMPSGKWGFRPLDPPSKTEPFRANVPLGFVGIHADALRDIIPAYTWHGEGEEVPIYARDEETGEELGLDFSLSKRLRDVGHEPWIDPALKCKHFKPFGMDSWPG